MQSTPKTVAIEIAPLQNAMCVEEGQVVLDSIRAINGVITASSHCVDRASSIALIEELPPTPENIALFSSLRQLLLRRLTWSMERVQLLSTALEKAKQSMEAYANANESFSRLISDERGSGKLALAQLERQLCRRIDAILNGQPDAMTSLVLAVDGHESNEDRECPSPHSFLTKALDWARQMEREEERATRPEGGKEDEEEEVEEGQGERRGAERPKSPAGRDEVPQRPVTSVTRCSVSTGGEIEPSALVTHRGSADVIADGTACNSPRPGKRPSWTGLFTSPVASCSAQDKTPHTGSTEIARSSQGSDWRGVGAMGEETSPAGPVPPSAAMAVSIKPFEDDRQTGEKAREGTSMPFEQNGQGWQYFTTNSSQENDKRQENGEVDSAKTEYAKGIRQTTKRQEHVSETSQSSISPVLQSSQQLQTYLKPSHRAQTDPKKKKYVRETVEEGVRSEGKRMPAQEKVSDVSIFKSFSSVEGQRPRARRRLMDEGESLNENNMNEDNMNEDNTNECANNNAVVVPSTLPQLQELSSGDKEDEGSAVKHHSLD